MIAGGCDYLNARVRGMASQMLTAETYEQVLAAEGENLLVDVLLGSPYGQQLRDTLSTARGITAIESALRRHLFDTYAGVLSMAPPGPRALLAVQLNLWDAANLITLLRGTVKGAPAEDTMAGIGAIGEIGEPQLLELASARDVAALADDLTTWGYRFAFEVRRAILDIADPNDLPALESSVSGAYFAWARGEAGRGGREGAQVLAMLEAQVDLANVRTALERVRRRAGKEQDNAFAPIPGGTLGPGLLDEIAGSASLVDAFAVLADTYFAPGIDKGILAFGRARSLGAMERFLEIVVIERGCRLFRGDPLSIAVPLGYLWRKYSEFLNLRILLRGKSFGMPANAMRKEMLIA